MELGKRVVIPEASVREGAEEKRDPDERGQPLNPERPRHVGLVLTESEERGRPTLKERSSSVSLSQPVSVIRAN